MATLNSRDLSIASSPRIPVVLSSAQTGTGDSTNTADRGPFNQADGGAIVVTNAAGATPTITVNVMGSVDNVNFYNIPYALVATPETLTVVAITITSAVTTTYLLRPNHVWRYLKLVYSANTNETMTATAYL